MVQLSEAVTAKIFFSVAALAAASKLVEWGRTTKQPIVIRDLVLSAFAIVPVTLLAPSVSLAEGMFLGALFAGLLGFLLIMVGVLNGRER